MNKVLVIDLDGTICTQMSNISYDLADPNIEVIKKLNQLWTNGWKVIIFTARGMNSCDGHAELAEEKYRSLTEKWLKDNRVCYDELKFGKPAATYYVDDKNMSLENFIINDELQ